MKKWFMTEKKKKENEIILQKRSGHLNKGSQRWWLAMR